MTKSPAYNLSARLSNPNGNYIRCLLFNWRFRVAKSHRRAEFVGGRQNFHGYEIFVARVRWVALQTIIWRCCCCCCCSRYFVQLLNRHRAHTYITTCKKLSLRLWKRIARLTWTSECPRWVCTTRPKLTLNEHIKTIAFRQPQWKENETKHNNQFCANGCDSAACWQLGPPTHKLANVFFKYIQISGPPEGGLICVHAQFLGNC